jgi:NADPH:quinone reductase-like Zn-dependent oxidoreductase
MRACVYDRYGEPAEVLRMEEIPEPVPTGDQVRVRIRVASVNAPDWRLVRADPILARGASGLLRPKIPTLGSDVAGTVDAVGPAATHLRVGDDVFGDLAPFGWGGFAEKVCVTEEALVRKPAAISFDDAAALPMAGLTALQGLRDRANVQAGQKVLIVGASGGVGTMAIQLAKGVGAEVGAVCSAGKAELARSLGADRVFDYATEDFAASGERWDAILAINGYRPIGVYRRCLTPTGTYLMVGGDGPQLWQGLLWGPILSLVGKRRLGPLTIHPSRDDLAHLADLVAEGRLKAVIDRRFPLDQVPAAVAYVAGGHARGKVLIDGS